MECTAKIGLGISNFAKKIEQTRYKFKSFFQSSNQQKKYPESIYKIYPWSNFLVLNKCLIMTEKFWCWNPWHQNNKVWSVLKMDDYVNKYIVYNRSRTLLRITCRKTGVFFKVRARISNAMMKIVLFELLSTGPINLDNLQVLYVHSIQYSSKVVAYKICICIKRLKKVFKSILYIWIL